MNALQRARNSIFLRHNAIVFAGSAIIGILNYIYYPIMGRLLEPAVFGEVQTLISLFLQASVLLTVLGLITITIVSKYRDAEQRSAVIAEFEKLALLVSAALVVLAVIFRHNVERFLQFESGWPFILLMVACVATVPLTFQTGFLRGVQRFGLGTGANMLSAAGKLLLGVVFVLGGLGTAGAVAGLVGAQIVASSFATWSARRNGLARPPRHRRFGLPSRRILAPELGYGLVVLAASLVVTLQYSIDIVIIKHLFDPHTAGLYAGIASVARIIFFATASVALVLMPMVRANQPPAQNRSLLKKSLVLLAVLGIPPLVLFSIFPELVARILMGQKYESLAYLLPKLSLVIFAVSILNVLVSYYLALRKRGIAIVALMGGATTYGLLLANHASLEAVINSLLIGSITMLFLLFIWRGSARFKGVLQA